MIDAEISLPIPTNCVVRDLKEHAKVKLIDVIPYGEGVKGLLEIKAKQCLKHILNIIKKNPFIYDKDFKILSEDKAKMIVTMKKCDIVRNILESGCLISNANVINGEVVFKIIARRNSLRKLIEKFSELGYQPRIIKIKEVDEETLLTPKEEEVLRVALKSGYFDVPKGIGIRGLAKKFGVSISTISEILRRGEKKVLLNYFKEKGEIL